MAKRKPRQRSHSIFEKQTDLQPGQLRAVAVRRLADANALIATGKNAHANGAQYLAGYAVEILLKARLFDHPALRDVRDDRYERVRRAVYKEHDLESLVELLNEFQGLDRALLVAERRTGIPCGTKLSKVCGGWTVFARYSTLTSDLGDARSMLRDVLDLKRVL